MPTQRKRIGYLPRAEVQKIIDQICKHNKLSQSKVTGILVEEALKTRRVLNSFPNNLSSLNDSDYSNLLSIDNVSFNSKTKKEDENINLNENYFKDEVRMINDYIEYKFFKNIMNKNKK